MMNSVILYDNECRLCCGVVSFLRRNDSSSKLTFVPLISPEGKGIAASAGVDELSPGTVVFADNGRYYYRSEAVIRILRKLGKGWQLMYIFIIIPAPLRDAVYNLISHNRYRYFGRGNC